MRSGAGAAAAPAAEAAIEEWPSGLLVFRWHEPPRLVLRRSEFDRLRLQFARSGTAECCGAEWSASLATAGRVGMGGGWRACGKSRREKLRGLRPGQAVRLPRMSAIAGRHRNLRAGFERRGIVDLVFVCCGRESGAGIRTSNRARSSLGRGLRLHRKLKSQARRR